jgi:hypothetical protein
MRAAYLATKVSSAVTDDGYACAVRNAGPVKSFQPSADAISWGRVFAYALRQPLLATSLGMIYQTELGGVDLAALFPQGGWLYGDLADDSDYKAQQQASFGLYGRLSVMCVSLSVATVYAVGQCNLDMAAETAVGPSLHMKFGFAAQIFVGLPVVGNVSVLYMVGVEIYTDSTQLIVSAFLLFQGQAELLGGIVGVTITIEAKGTIVRASNRTDLAAQVTFGLDISIFLVIDISFSTSWQEQRQIA